MRNKISLLYLLVLIATTFCFAQKSAELNGVFKPNIKYIEVHVDIFSQWSAGVPKLTWFSDTIQNEYYDEYISLKRILVVERPLLIMVNKFSEKGWELVSTYSFAMNDALNNTRAVYYFKKEY